MILRNACKYSSICGGCDFIDNTYEETLSLKLNNFIDLLKKENFAIKNDIKIIPSPKTNNYRTRTQIHIENGKVGFYEKRTNNLIEIEECLMLDPRLNEKIKSFNFPKNYSNKIELYIKNGLVSERIVEKKGDNLFSQVNTEVNKLLIKEVIGKLNLSKDDNVLELYSGMGNFTFEIAKKSKVVAIDINTHLKNFQNIEFIKNDVSKTLKEIENRIPTFNKLLMDPPRKGLSKDVIDMINKNDFKKIVYVSCNPLALVNDLRKINKAKEKDIEIKLFDMFPYTKHVESVVSF